MPQRVLQQHLTQDTAAEEHELGVFLHRGIGQVL